MMALMKQNVTEVMTHDFLSETMKRQLLLALGGTIAPGNIGCCVTNLGPLSPPCGRTTCGGGREERERDRESN